jgi:hypothetical protein
MASQTLFDLRRTSHQPKSTAAKPHRVPIIFVFNVVSGTKIKNIITGKPNNMNKHPNEIDRALVRLFIGLLQPFNKFNFYGVAGVFAN